MDHSVSGTQTAFKVVGEPDPGSAHGVQIIVRCGNEGGPRHLGQQAL
jgi:hypothetical protein